MSDSTSDLLRRLAERIDDMESRVAVGGRWTPTTAVAIVFPGGPRIELVSPKRGTVKKGLDALLPRMKPAPFGAGGKTKVDRRIRDALQLDVGDEPFEIEGFDPASSDILETVRAALTPDAEGGLWAELRSVNAYGPGGHFERHKDTPRGKDMVGTLVVCLPFAFAGGALSLERGNAGAVFDWAQDLERHPRCLHYAAFFGDVDHEIAEVGSGHRVTLSYVLRLEKAARVARSRKVSKESACDGELSRLFASVASDAGLRADGATLRIPCEHQYAVQPSTPAQQWVTEEMARALKGRDAQVARAALAARLPVALVHCLAVVGDGEELLNVRLAEAPTAKRIDRIRRRISASDVETLEDSLAAEDPAPRGLRTIGGWYNGVLVGAADYSQTGYYGNEASEADFYISSVLDVSVPPESGGRGDRVAHPKFGPGIVLSESRRGTERAFTIRFADGEERTVLERFLQRPS